MADRAVDARYGQRRELGCESGKARILLLGTLKIGEIVMGLSLDVARDHFCILYNALCKFNGAGGNLHILVEDGNIEDADIAWLREYMVSVRDQTSVAQFSLETAILGLFEAFDVRDREFILNGYYLEPNAKAETSERSGDSSPAACSRIRESYDGVPCTCKDNCPDPCKGACGCKACHTAYQDFLSNE